MNSTLAGPPLATPLRSARDLVVRGIGGCIVAGQYTIGSPLPGDADLVERFTVARLSRRLPPRGLIESKANVFEADILSWRLQRGIDARFFEYLCYIPQALEPLAPASAAQCRTDDDICRIARPGAAWMRPIKCEKASLGSLSAFTEPFSTLLATLYCVRQRGDRTALAVALNALVDDPERFTGALHQHRAILDAIIACDVDAASAACPSPFLEQVGMVVSAKRRAHTDGPTTNGICLCLPLPYRPMNSQHAAPAALEPCSRRETDPLSRDYVLFYL